MSGAASAYLIAELRRRRELAGLTQEQWGAALHWSAQHVSAVERGARPIRLDYLATIDRVFNCDYSTLWELLLRTERAPVWLRPWLEHEREAIMLRWYEPLLVPGLLQTEAYARVVLTHAGVAIDDVDTTVGDRLGRQEILHRAERPCRFVDGPLEGQTIELEADLTRLEHAWESLREYALPSEQSVALMQEAADRWA